MAALASSLLVLALASVASPVPRPTPTPFAIGTFSPDATPGPPAPQLPEIGRVRSATPACAAMRDLIIPSFAASRRADARFAETQKRLPNYVEIADDPEHRTDVYRESALSRLDQDATALLQEALMLNKALGDPRLSAEQKDPEVSAERRALQQLYESQMTRANLLTEFVTRQRVAIAKNGIDTGTSAFGVRHAPSTAAPLRTEQPIPALTAPPGMPVLGGIDLSDKQQIDQWAGEIQTFVRSGENQAAKVFLPIAQRCR